MKLFRTNDVRMVENYCKFYVFFQLPREMLKNGLDIARSHTRTVMRECYKDDGESLWKSLKFDPSPR